MTYTSHGHHIPGTTTSDEFGQVSRARCGGTLLCPTCAKDANAIMAALDKGINVEGFFEAPSLSDDEMLDQYISKAKLFVIGARNNVVSEEADQITVNELSLIFTHSLPQIWVVMLRLVRPTENLIFKVTHSDIDDVTIVNTYQQIERDVFSQEGHPE